MKRFSSIETHGEEIQVEFSSSGKVTQSLNDGRALTDSSIEENKLISFPNYTKRAKDMPFETERVSQRSNPSEDYMLKTNEKSHRVFDYSKMSADLKDKFVIKGRNDDSNKEMEIHTTSIERIVLQNDESKTKKLQCMTVDFDVTTISLNIAPKEVKETPNSRDTTDGSNSEGKNAFTCVDYKESMAEQIEIQQNSDSKTAQNQSSSTSRSGNPKAIAQMQKDFEIEDDYDLKENKINPKDIHVIKPIGSGSFGTVYLW
jgi:hypothetical protein